MTQQTEVPTELAAMYEAHVQYEVERLTGDGLDRAVADEVAAVMRTLGELTLGELAPVEQLVAAVGQVLAMPITELSRSALAQWVVDWHAAAGSAAGEAVTLEEVLPKEEYDALVSLVIGMDGVRREAMQQLTASSVYSRLVAHVMVFGIKNYLTTENVLAKKIPGVQSLAKLGQKGLNAAVSGLDDHLVSFVNANIKDVVGESQRYLDRLLDEPLLRSVADEIRATNGPRTIASLAGLVTEDQVAQAVYLGLDVVEVARQTEFFEQATAQVITRTAARHTDRTVVEVLGDLGVTEDLLGAHLAAAMRPLLAQRSRGVVEAEIRSRLAPFYRSYAEQPRG